MYIDCALLKKSIQKNTFKFSPYNITKILKDILENQIMIKLSYLSCANMAKSANNAVCCRSTHVRNPS